MKFSYEKETLYNLNKERNKHLGIAKTSKSTQRVNTRYQNGNIKKLNKSKLNNYDTKV